MSHEIVLYSKGKGKGLDDPLKRFTKRTVDYGSDLVRWMEDLSSRPKRRRFQRHYSYTKELVPPFAMPHNPYDGICPRFVHAAVNKNRSPVHVVTWFPNGRRVLTGTLAGEMTIWSGLQFHSENVMQAHNAGIKAMKWTPDESVMVSGDQLGFIKLWDQYIYNFQTFQGHKDSVCDIAIAPTGEKFCSCADDSHAKVWDLRTGDEERAFTGHGWDVKCCAWHPLKGLVATGSKDSQIKLWDPRASEAITTIFCHKNTVTQVAWSPSGSWLASASRDQLVMLLDIRTMSVRKVFKAHQKEVTSLCWHPESDGLLASGGYDGALHFWGTMGSALPIESLPMAHEGPVWSLAWHPLGHLLVSGSNDYSTRFWSRGRPGDENFEQFLPKRVGLGSAETLTIPPTPPTSTDGVLKAGVLSALPAPAPTPELLSILNGTLALAPEPEPEKPEEPSDSTPMVGLSLGEGPNAKSVLDTADFDAEERPEKRLTKVEPEAEAKPVKPVKTEEKADKPTVVKVEEDA
ncbi:unnamed protein product [Effrenium voratum]|uniref:Polyadenylation factor subunit 2 n=1 Tax=Effrenium voratum TaxID=2562239 RepID=A0AA36MRM0_9DINO|nr:unnamed protein product [Effrenium voratum]CAJ1427357.1 unnamed protein product [Effrenium voratum]